MPASVGPSAITPHGLPGRGAQNTQPGRAVPAPPVRTRGHGGPRAHGEGARRVWGLSWLRGSGPMCLSAAQAEGPGLWDLRDPPWGTGPGPKAWMQGPWDVPPGGTACSLGAHPMVPTAADLQPFHAAASAKKPHSTAEHFINEQTLHLRGLRSRGLGGCKQPDQLPQHVSGSLA